MPKTLYLCYFGLREPLVQTQVIPYLLEISKGGTEISLLTFEPELRRRWTASMLDEERSALAAMGIKWHCLAYHKRLSALATGFDVFRGVSKIMSLLKHEKYNVMHARVHVPMLMAALLRILTKQNPKLIFDIRGFFPEEYIDAGKWKPNGLLYRLVKRVEIWLMKEADGFVVLTEMARSILFPESTGSGYDKDGRPVEVIPCCVDFEGRFSGNSEELRLAVRKELNVNDRRVIVHVGALGGLYLVREIADLLAAARDLDSGVFGLFLTQSDRKLLEPLLLERGFGTNDYYFGRVPPVEIERYLYASDIGLSIVKATFATQSRSPTKIPEYLACGLPIIANSGVGDVDKLILENGVGALLTDFSPEGYAAALAEVESLGDIAEKCRETAHREFDLTSVGGVRYRRLYKRLSEKTG